MRHPRAIIVIALLVGSSVLLTGCGGADSNVGPSGAGVVGKAADSESVPQGNGTIADRIFGGYTEPAPTTSVANISDPVLGDPDASTTLDDSSMSDSMPVGDNPFSSVGLDDTSADTSAMNASLSDNLTGGDLSFDSALGSAPGSESMGGETANPVASAVSNLSLTDDAVDDPSMDDPSLDDPTASPDF